VYNPLATLGLRDKEAEIRCAHCRDAELGRLGDAFHDRLELAGRLQEAAKIGDEELLRSFREKVRPHREIVPGFDGIARDKG
jgi:hypothetical protein